MFPARWAGPNGPMGPDRSQIGAEITRNRDLRVGSTLLYWPIRLLVNWTTVIVEDARWVQRELEKVGEKSDGKSDACELRFGIARSKSCRLP